MKGDDRNYQFRHLEDYVQPCYEENVVKWSNTGKFKENS